MPRLLPVWSNDNRASLVESGDVAVKCLEEFIFMSWKGISFSFPLRRLPPVAVGIETVETGRVVLTIVTEGSDGLAVLTMLTIHGSALAPLAPFDWQRSLTSSSQSSACKSLCLTALYHG